MKPAEQVIAILEALGYEKIEVDYESFDPQPGYEEGPDGTWRTPSHNKWLKQIDAQRVMCVGRYFVHVTTGQIYADFDGPNNGDNGRGKFDFLNDLNAMHEAIMAQDVTTRDRINMQLFEILDPRRPFIIDRAVNATAAQRAEAFLRTIGKWKD